MGFKLVAFVGSIPSNQETQEFIDQKCFQSVKNCVLRGFLRFGGQCRTRTCDLLLVSTAFTKIQHFSEVCMRSDSLAKMRASALYVISQLNPSKRALGTILGTVC